MVIYDLYHSQFFPCFDILVLNSLFSLDDLLHSIQLETPASPQKMLWKILIISLYIIYLLSKSTFVAKWLTYTEMKVFVELKMFW